MLTLEKKGSWKAYTVLKHLISTNHRAHQRPESARRQAEARPPWDHQPHALAAGALLGRCSRSSARPALPLAQREHSRTRQKPALGLDLLRRHPEGLAEAPCGLLTAVRTPPPPAGPGGTGVCGFPDPVLFLLKRVGDPVTLLTMEDHLLPVPCRLTAHGSAREHGEAEPLPSGPHEDSGAPPTRR